MTSAMDMRSGSGYYSAQMALARIGNVPYDPSMEVITAWDIGVGDATAIIFVQRYGMELRVIDYYENSGEGLAHYVRVLREKGYTYGRAYAPWASATQLQAIDRVMAIVREALKAK